MSFKINASSLKNIEKEMIDISIIDSGEIDYDDLFTSRFMSSNTQFSSFSDFLKFGGYDISTKEEFDALPEDEFGEHIRSTTSFESWEDMQNSAANFYSSKR